MERSNGMKRGIIFFTLCAGIFIGNTGFGQSKVFTNTQLWTTYQMNARLAPKWGVWVDLNQRTQGSFIDDQFQQAARVGIIHHFTNQKSVAVGYAYFRHYRPRTGFDEVLPENRIWAQYLKTIQQGNIQFAHRLRAEVREMKRPAEQATPNDDVQTFGRFRYQLQARISLSKKKSKLHPDWLIVSNEIMIHGGESIDRNIFDQNRLSAGYEWQAHKTVFLQAAYMHLLQFQPIPDRWRQSHVIRLTIRHQPDWSKKK